MKINKIESKNHRGLYLVLGSVLLAVCLTAGLLGIGKLKSVYHEQCRLTNPGEQLFIETGKMVKPDVIAENLGLKVGANLAEIDFAARREEILKKIPTLRTISISRIQPNQIHITAEERVPIARMNIRGQRAVSGRVVDTEGMVFICQRGTQMLPTIREMTPPGVQAGNRITGRTLAALRLIETCREREFLELGVLEVDVSKPDFLVMTLADYSRVKITWDGIDEPNERSRPDLLNRLTNLLKAIRSNVGAGTVIWNATMPGMTFADTQNKL